MPKIDCKPIREKKLKEVKDEIDYLGAKPTLAIISCSNDEASVLYMRNKIKTCESVGIKVTHYNLIPKETDTNEEIQKNRSHQSAGSPVHRDFRLPLQEIQATTGKVRGDHPGTV